MKTIKPEIQEFPAFRINGFVMLVVLSAIAFIGGWYVWQSVNNLQVILARGLQITDLFGGEEAAEAIAWLLATLLVIVIPSISGFFSVEPNQATDH